MSGVGDPQDLAPYPRWPNLRPLLWKAPELLLVPCPLGPPSILGKVGRRSRGSCGPWGGLRTPSGALFQPPHPLLLFPSLLVPIPMRVGEGTCGAVLRTKFGLQLHPFLGCVAWANDQLLWSCFSSWTMSIMAHLLLRSSEIDA